ncbi:MAG: pantetheine-phosphate adenylyltransferase [Patescibacteria group bacterium]
MKTAIYPFSADPIHNGHIYNIGRILESGLFDRVYVAIGKNYEKNRQYLFGDAEKVEITKKALKKFGGKVKVEAFDGLLVHYANKKHTNIIIRGSRNNTDFEEEQTMAEFNKSYGLQTYIIPAPKDVFNISSTTIKAIVGNGGLVHEYVPVNVKQALEEKLLGITLVGVVGNTGSGKTSLCKKLKGVSVIDVDKLIHEIYQKNKLVNQDLQDVFGGKIFIKNKLDKKKLGSLIFNDSLSRQKLANILEIPFKVALEEKLTDLKGLVLLDCAYLVEYDLLSVVNNNIILLTCSNEEKIKRNKRAEEILQAQFDDKKLEQEIKAKIKKDSYGNLLKINTENKIDFNKIAKHLKSWQILHS